MKPGGQFGSLRVQGIFCKERGTDWREICLRLLTVRKAAHYRLAAQIGRVTQRRDRRELRRKYPRMKLKESYVLLPHARWQWNHHTAAFSLARLECPSRAECQRNGLMQRVSGTTMDRTSLSTPATPFSELRSEVSEETLQIIDATPRLRIPPQTAPRPWVSNFSVRDVASVCYITSELPAW